MEYDKVMEDIVSIDKRLRYEYDEINKTIFKGSDRNDLVTVDMTGNFCIEKITFNEEMKDVEKMSDAVKEAFNNALENIKKTRIETVKEILKEIR